MYIWHQGCEADLWELLLLLTNLAGPNKVASHLYSYSFALKPDWSQKFALRQEIMEYFISVANSHGVTKNIVFKSTVKTTVFDGTTGTWLVTIQDQKTDRVHQRRAKILISAVGALTIPNECDIKGAGTFRGKMFHSARWDHSFDWEGKDVVVIGKFATSPPPPPSPPSSSPSLLTIPRQRL